MGLADHLQRQKRLRGGYTVRDWVPPRTGPYGRELHAPLANFEGPRTDIKRRLKEGVKPTSHTDAASRQHDIAYYNTGVRLARGQINRAEAIKQVKQADNRLMKSALYSKLSLNPVENMHANLALAGIAGKKVLQGIGAMDELKFVNPHDDELLQGGKKKTSLVKGLKRRLRSTKSLR